MIHVFEFVSKAPAISLAEFTSRWTDVVQSDVTEHPSVRQCTMLTRSDTTEPADGVPADGVVELWFESLAAYREFDRQRSSDTHRQKMLGEIIADAPHLRLITDDRVIFHRRAIASDDQLVKLLYVIKRAEGHSLEHFSRYYQHVHTLYSSAPPFQRNYVQAHRIPDVTEQATEQGAGPSLTVSDEFDGVSCIWFEDQKGLDGYLASAELERGVADCQQFLDLSRFFSITGVEHRVRWAGLPSGQGGDNG